MKDNRIKLSEKTENLIFSWDVFLVKIYSTHSPGLKDIMDFNL